MINEIKELSELTKIILNANSVIKNEPFLVEGMPVQVDIMLEGDTLLPFIALYANYMGQLLFGENNLFSHKIIQTKSSLFYMKLADNKESEDSFASTHLKLLILNKLFVKLLDKNTGIIDLTKSVNKCREIFNTFKEGETISIDELSVIQISDFMEAIDG